MGVRDLVLLIGGDQVANVSFLSHGRGDRQKQRRQGKTQTPADSLTGSTGGTEVKRALGHRQEKKGSMPRDVSKGHIHSTAGEGADGLPMR